jgi:hypothetical protein
VTAEYDAILVVPSNMAPGKLRSLEEESASRVFGASTRRLATFNDVEYGRLQLTNGLRLGERARDIRNHGVYTKDIGSHGNGITVDGLLNKARGLTYVAI